MRSVLFQGINASIRQKIDEYLMGVTGDKCGAPHLSLFFVFGPCYGEN